MIYIEKDDLIGMSQERFIDESSQNDTDILDTIELKQINIVKSYIGTKYDVDTIFEEGEILENEVLKDIISKLVLYRLFKRNPARMVPKNYKEDYDEAMKQLKELATGVIRLDGLPVALDSTGAIRSNSISGNLSNPNFYI